MELFKDVKIVIRIISEIEQGYIINSPEVVAKMFGTALSNTELVDPDKNKTLQISPDDTYTFNTLYRDICKKIGIRPMFAVDSDCPAFFDMLIELDDNYLIGIDDYNILLNKVLKAFHSNSIIVYLKIIPGRGELYRGDGIKIFMRAEPDERHHGAHVHVWGGDDRNASISIEDEKEYAGNLNKKERKKALAIIRENKDVLLEIWETLIEGISIDVDYKLGRISFVRLT